MATYKTPGVYIEEIPAVGPITGVGTSTAAFIGPALQGPLFLPTKITNWSQFKDNFGGYIAAPRHYLAYAVEGFFKNGGTVAYIVRVGTASRAFLALNDRAAGQALRVEAKEEGPAGNGITVQVQDAQIVTAASVAKPQATVLTAANTSIRVTNALDAATFKPGDTITIHGSAERAVISRIRGDEIFLETNLGASYNAGTVRIANLIPTQQTVRLADASGLEGGSVVRLSQGGTNETRIIERLAGNFVTFSQGLTNTYGMAAGDAAVGLQSFEFNLIVRAPGYPDETFERLAMDSRHSRYFSKIVNSLHVTVRLPDTPSIAPPPNNRPAVVGATNLAGGTADNLAGINAGHYTQGLETLVKVDDVNILCVPDRTDATVQQAMIEHCEAMADRFAILDPWKNAAPFGPGGILDQRRGLESKGGYGAHYYPWLHIADPQSSNSHLLPVPPSGHLAGIFARSDQKRGVHKAPANELINGALQLERVLTDVEQGELNIEGVNVLRLFPNQGRPVVWGARTTAPAAEAPWRYINVRRLLLYIEESIEEGIRWAVFEPNDLGLWQKLKRTIAEFLTRVWRDGALFGATPAEAFYVKCDEELNPSSTRALGQVFVEIGVAPVRPAEFVIIRIGQWEGGSETTEG